MHAFTNLANARQSQGQPDQVGFGGSGSLAFADSSKVLPTTLNTLVRFITLSGGLGNVLNTQNYKTRGTTTNVNPDSLEADTGDRPITASLPVSVSCVRSITPSQLKCQLWTD